MLAMQEQLAAPNVAPHRLSSSGDALIRVGCRVSTWELERIAPLRIMTRPVFQRSKFSDLAVDANSLLDLCASQSLYPRLVLVLS
jgi:hypothetical protein